VAGPPEFVFAATGRSKAAEVVTGLRSADGVTVVTGSFTATGEELAEWLTVARKDSSCSRWSQQMDDPTTPQATAAPTMNFLRLREDTTFF
jgi:hypothetical protein